MFNHVSFLDKQLFTKHLAVMLKSGITIVEALETLTAQTKSEAFKKVLKALLRDVSNGQSLAISLKKHPKVFDNFFISLIEISEESGTLDENLEFMAKELSKEYAMRKKIQGALMYPAIVLTTMIVVGAGLSLFVLPKLVDLFSTLDVVLPLSTQILLFIANLMKNYGIFIFAGLFIFLFLLRIALGLPSIKPFWHRFLLSIPLLGPFLQNSQIATMCRNLGIMIKSGIPIRRALTVQYNVTENLVFKDYVGKLLKSVEKGKSMEEELSSGKYSLISPIAIKMIGVGEKSGKIDEMFLYLGDFFEEEVDSTSKNLSVILEPVILLVIGLLVAFVALAIISPIYQLTGSIKR